MSQRVLVFESDAAFAGEVKSNFERMGLAVDVAGDGPSGLELAAVHRPDLILLTIELPGMNGFLVCKKIKKTSELESVPLVILSSEVDQETFEQHKKLRTRADEYIRKPIAFADLLSRVQDFVPHSNGVDALAAENDDGVDAAEETALDIEEAFSVGDDDVIVLADDDEEDADDYAAETNPPLAAAPHDVAPIAYADTAQYSEVTHQSDRPSAAPDLAAAPAESEPPLAERREAAMAPRVAPPPLLSFRPQPMAAEVVAASPSAPAAFAPPPSAPAAFASPPSAAGAFAPPPSAAGSLVSPPSAAGSATLTAEFERMKR
ncbi:MAG TPA: response regulator, partial [Polyangiales bacterium]